MSQVDTVRKRRRCLLRENAETLLDDPAWATRRSWRTHHYDAA